MGFLVAVHGLLTVGASLAAEHRLSGFSGFSSQALEHRRSRYGSWGWLFHSMWVLRSLIREGIHVPCIGRWILNHQATREALSMSSYKDTSHWMKAQPSPV